MSHRTYIVIALVWLLSLATVGAFASGQLYRLPTTAEGRAKLDALTEPLVLSGSDIGFRVEGSIGDVPAGRLVIRIDGEWVEPKASSQAGVVPVR